MFTKSSGRVDASMFLTLWLERVELARKLSKLLKKWKFY